MKRLLALLIAALLPDFFLGRREIGIALAQRQ
jgi:hypothetical protein